MPVGVVIGIVTSVISALTSLFGTARSLFSTGSGKYYATKLANYNAGWFAVKEYIFGNGKYEWSRDMYFSPGTEYYFFDRTIAPLNRTVKAGWQWGEYMDRPLGKTNTTGKRYFSFGKFDSFVWDYDPEMVRKIKENKLGRDDWFFMSQNPQMMLWTPSGWILAPMTGYDYMGNFYYVDNNGQAEMLQPFDKDINATSDAEDIQSSTPDPGSRYSTFSGTSVRNWYESLQVLEQEKKVSEIQAREAEVEKALLTEKEAEQKQYQANRSLYLRNGLITVGVLTGVYFIYKFIKKRKKL